MHHDDDAKTHASGYSKVSQASRVSHMSSHSHQSRVSIADGKGGAA